MDSTIEKLKIKLRTGVSPAMATPFQQDDISINEPVVDQVVEFLIQAGVDGLFVGGASEASVLEPETYFED